eukprot:TRINITY_DN6287_c0_g2_i8.p2 TRINITY_DN6287_c0_g2~~TRINITY_DN6287_c0_g2_i8.p2  ORF type:complete len:115 (-),score=34.69 TRINITY_DN6287_c0_g2_i8:275-619(-)
MCIRDRYMGTLLLRGTMQENLTALFQPIVAGCTLDINNVLEGQERLCATLNKLNSELEEIYKLNYYDKDREVAEYLDKINAYKKRLSTINSKMDKLQSRVETIEKRFMKVIKPK